MSTAHNGNDYERLKQELRRLKRRGAPWYFESALHQRLHGGGRRRPRLHPGARGCVRHALPARTCGVRSHGAYEPLRPRTASGGHRSGRHAFPSSPCRQRSYSAFQEYPRREGISPRGTASTRDGRGPHGHVNEDSWGRSRSPRRYSLGAPGHSRFTQRLLISGH